MFDSLFQRKKVNTEKLLTYGFEQTGEGYRYSTEILDRQFLLHIDISPVGAVETNVYDHHSGEEYVLYKTSAVGSFVGEVRSACEDVLREIADHCWDIEVFRSEQAKMIIQYVREKYGDELEFLWKRSPNNAIWRRKDTEKWYGAILTVSRDKLGLESTEVVEIIDLRVKPEKMEQLLSQEGYYPGWHMNKKHWYTIILDGSLSDEEICKCVDESFGLAF